MGSLIRMSNIHTFRNITHTPMIKQSDTSNHNPIDPDGFFGLENFN